MKTYEDFFSYLNDLHNNYSDLSTLLKQKIEAVDLFDVARLDDIMREEQAYVLLSKGFDGAIGIFKADLSLNGDTLKDMIPQMPEEQQDRFREIYGQLSLVLAQVKDINEKCQELLGLRLHVVEQQLKELEKASKPRYGKGGDAIRPSSTQPRMFTKSV